MTELAMILWIPLAIACMAVAFVFTLGSMPDAPIERHDPVRSPAGTSRGFD